MQHSKFECLIYIDIVPSLFVFLGNLEGFWYQISSFLSYEKKNKNVSVARMSRTPMRNDLINNKQFYTCTLVTTHFWSTLCFFPLPTYIYFIFSKRNHTVFQIFAIRKKAIGHSWLFANNRETLSNLIEETLNY